MLHRGPAPSAPATGKRRALCSARGENHICALGAKGRSDLRARPLDQAFGRTPLGMHTRGIANNIHCRNHRRTPLGPQRRRRVIIKVNPRHYTASPSSWQKYSRRRRKPAPDRAPPLIAPGRARCRDAEGGAIPLNAGLIPRPPQKTDAVPPDRAPACCQPHR